MRTVIATGVLAFLATGCSDTCGVGQQLNGQVYSAFIHPIEYDFGDNGEGEANFPGAASPANGPIELSFEWGVANEGPITVYMNGQPFAGTGIFDEQECGNFIANWEGAEETSYIAEGGSEHAFKAAALFMFYDDVLEGQLSYAEVYRTPRGEVGPYRVTLGEVRGQLKATAGGSN
jgi:hypothetical protein